MNQKQKLNQISLSPNHSIHYMILNMYEKQSRNTNRSSDTIASFLLKTYEILEHPEYQRTISWDKSNVGFIIHDVASFTRQILPKYFRHSNFSSFVRQLNMYDFHKVKQQNDSLVFKNPLFCKGEQQNLKFIRRKAAKKVGGQRKQQANDKNDVQNQKYQNLLKGFKKSFESELNQSSIFYERSIHLMKGLNESNLKKQSYIGNLYENDYKNDTTDEIKNQEPVQNGNNPTEGQSKPRKDTIIQIPKEFLEPEQAQRQQEKQQKEKKKSLNLDSLMLLKEQVYKSLGVYQSWLQDYIQTHRKKIKYISGYRQQLVKCRQSRNNDNPQNNGGQNQEQNDQNYGSQQNQQKDLALNQQNGTNNNNCLNNGYQTNQNQNLFNPSPEKAGKEHQANQQVKISTNQIKVQNKAISPPTRPQRPEAAQESQQPSQVSAKPSPYDGFLSMNPGFSAKLFSTFSKPRQQKSEESESSQYQNHYINQSQEDGLGAGDYENQDENQI